MNPSSNFGTVVDISSEAIQGQARKLKRAISSGGVCGTPRRSDIKRVFIRLSGSEKK
jgi:hypothetical protein